MPAADLLAEAKAALEAGDHAGAGELYSAPCCSRSRRTREAWGGLIRALMALGQEEQARAGARQVPAKIAEHAEIAGARSALALAEEGREAPRKLRQLQAGVGRRPGRPSRRAMISRPRSTPPASARQAADALLEIIRPRPRLERGRGPAAAAEVLRGLGLRGPGDAGGAPQAVRAAVPLMAAFHPHGRRSCRPSSPVFPLPGALLLPRGRLPLNIFEPRYLAMVEDALGARPHVRHDPARSRPAPRGDDRAGAVSRRLPRPAHLLQRDRRRAVPDHADRRDPLRGRARAGDAARLPARARRTSPASPPTSTPSRTPDRRPRELLLGALRAYFAPRGFEANWEAIERDAGCHAGDRRSAWSARSSPRRSRRCWRRRRRRTARRHAAGPAADGRAWRQGDGASGRSVS